MSKPYDATLNALIDVRPDDWAAFLAARIGLPPGPATLLDTDLSVTAQSDKAFRLAGPPPAVIHLEVETGAHAGVPARLLRYNVLLGHPRPGAAEEPVHTVIVLLKRGAGATDLTGRYTRAGANGAPYLDFRYTVIRLWEESMAALLAGGPTLAPLALATAESEADLPGAVARFAERLRQPDVPGNVRGELTSFGIVLAGLVHEPEDYVPLFLRMSMTFEGTAGFEWIKQLGVTVGRTEGKAEEARRLVQRLAERRFGMSPAAGAALGAITDTARLERLADRILDATDWTDLLATP